MVKSNVIDTRPKPFVFVLMPFEDNFNDIYKLGIKKACENAGAYAERLDEQIFQESMLQRIYNQIDKSDIIVADMTSRNPNVFYEVGYAHALGKHVILLTQKSEDIPFDLKHYPHIIYGQQIAQTLIPELEKRVKWAIEHPTNSVSQFESPLQFYIGGVSLQHTPSIKCIFAGDPCSIILQIDANNSVENIVRNVSCQIALLTPEYIYKSKMPGFSVNVVKLPDGDLLHIPNIKLDLLPGGWDSVRIELISDSQHPFHKDQVEQITLRVFSEYDRQDHLFLVNFQPNK